jgi:WD40 repeat protein
VALHKELYFYNMAIDDEFESSLYRRFHFHTNEEIQNAIKFSPRNNRIALGYISGSIICYDYYKEKNISHKKQFHNGRVTALEWEGSSILSGGKDSVVKAYDMNSGK